MNHYNTKDVVVSGTKKKLDMKSDLLIKKFDTEYVVGTRTPIEIKSFFGGKLIDIEDEIIVNNISIQYSEVVDKVNLQFDHYQNYDTKNSTISETIFLKSLDDIKLANHSVDIYSQLEKQYSNFEWAFVIDTRNILKEYLFLKLKQSRVFKCIKSSDLVEKNINDFIYNYITNNLLNRYNLYRIDFFVEYFNISEVSNLYDKNKLIKNPNFNKNVFFLENITKNLNIITPDYLSNLDPVKMIFNQTKDYTQYKFDYYFTVIYKKI